MMDIEKYIPYAPALVRISLSLVFLWFGISQLIAPSDWLGYLPTWTESFSIPQIAFIYGNTIVEIIFGSLLILGVFTRISALILSLHLFGIAFSLGYNAIAIRDLGLALATLSIALHGSDILCMKK